MTQLARSAANAAQEISYITHSLKQMTEFDKFFLDQLRAFCNEYLTAYASLNYIKPPESKL